MSRRYRRFNQNYYNGNRNKILLLGDIYGRVWSVLNNEGNFNPYYIYGTTTSKEKWRGVRENLEGPALDKYKKIAKKFFRRINKRHKDKIYVIVTNDYLGAFEAASQGLGWPFYARMVRKDPRFIKEVHTVIAQFTAELYKSYMDAGAEVFVESGDLAYKTGGPGGGFIVSAANMHPAVKVQNLRWMVEATHKFGNYPLNL
ncbi:hypothetical protein ES703_55058 [subsurface metagenome]